MQSSRQFVLRTSLNKNVWIAKIANDLWICGSLQLCYQLGSAAEDTAPAGGSAAPLRCYNRREPLTPGPHHTRQRCFGPVCDRPSASRPVPRLKNKNKIASSAAGGGFHGTERAGTRSDGRKQGRNGADGCGEDRAWQVARTRRRRRLITFMSGVMSDPRDWPWIKRHLTGRGRETLRNVSAASVASEGRRRLCPTCATSTLLRWPTRLHCEHDTNWTADHWLSEFPE